MNATTAPVTLFYCYAHEDKALRDQLEVVLKLLERRRQFAPWHDRKIVPGEDWSAAIDTHLRNAELVLLLVSQDFTASDYIWGTELALAMERQAAHAAVVVPIILRPTDLEPDPDDPKELRFLQKLQSLPTDRVPVTSWPDRDQAWLDVSKGLRAAVKGIRERRPVAAPAPAVSRSAAARTEPPDDDSLLNRIVADVAGQVEQAQRERSVAPLSADSEALLQAQTRALIDLPEQQRVLWVDDRPEGNRLEISALVKLQIEVVTARGTDEALQVIAADTEGFGLVISNWERAREPAQAGLRLLARLRQTGIDWPLVFYHGEQGGRRAQRAAEARAAGALGEAVLPDELMTLVLQALQAAPAPHHRPLPKGVRE